MSILWRLLRIVCVRVCFFYSTSSYSIFVRCIFNFCEINTRCIHRTHTHKLNKKKKHYYIYNKSNEKDRLHKIITEIEKKKRNEMGMKKEENKRERKRAREIEKEKEIKRLKCDPIKRLYPISYWLAQTPYAVKMKRLHEQCNNVVGNSQNF